MSQVGLGLVRGILRAPTVLIITTIVCISHVNVILCDPRKKNLSCYCCRGRGRLLQGQAREKLRQMPAITNVLIWQRIRARQSKWK